MKVVIMAFTMLLGTYCLAQNDYYRDSLQIEIGSKARILFQAKEKADFELIKRYDLNKLFEELLLRAEQNDSAVVEILSLLDSKKFAQQNPFKVISKKTKEIFLRFNFGLYTGITVGNYFVFPITTNNYIIPELGGNINVQHSGTVNVIPDFLSAGFFVNSGLLLHNAPRLGTEIKLSFGYERSDFNLQVYRSLDFAFEGSRPLSKAENEQLNGYYKTMRNSHESNQTKSFNVKYSQFYIQLMPQIELKNVQGEGTWRAGLGARGMANLNLRRAGTTEALTIISHPLTSYNLSIPTRYSRSVYQWAVIGKIGYKRWGLFAQCAPKALVFQHYNWINTGYQNGFALGHSNRVNSTRFNAWMFGVTIGDY
jgi:hypothetical protein